MSSSQLTKSFIFQRGRYATMEDIKIWDSMARYGKIYGKIYVFFFAVGFLDGFKEQTWVSDVLVAFLFGFLDGFIGPGKDD